MSERVINRHRPLRPGELRASVRRVRRYGHPEDVFEEVDRYWLDLYEEEERRWSRDYDFDPAHRPWWIDGSIDSLLFELSQRIDASPAFNPLVLERPAPTSPTPPDEIELATEAGASLEQRLAQHLTQQPSIEALLPGDEFLDDLRLMHEVAEHRLGSLYDFVGGRGWRGSRDPMIAILLFRPFWIRSPRSWRPPATGTASELVASLVEHVFARFPFPRFLLHAWLAPRGAFDLRPMAWTLALSQGASLRRLHRLVFRDRWSEGFGPLPKKLPAHLLRVPARCSVADGLMFAEVLRLGGSATEVRRLGLDHSFCLDPTLLADDSDDRHFWEGTVRWLVRHRETLDALGDDACERILPWARHRHTERRREPFSWSGRSAPAALAEARAYRQFLVDARHRRLRWSSHEWDQSYTIGGTDWTIEELTTSEALTVESAAMSHCVRMYDRACYQGRSAIFSVRSDGRRRVTVELHPSTRTLVQVCGPCNRRPSSEETGVVARWHRSLITEGSTTPGR